MRIALLLTLALFSTSSLAVSGSLHKCKTKGGAVYFTDKACSTKNAKDKEPVLDQNADPQQAAPPPPQKKKK